ncbi:hypothetical protein HDU97_007803 [Phlyctochytrium planicorne]|nr:hypothetical protein HDU97_007803 [Phlyctochytrium planicorne]
MLTLWEMMKILNTARGYISSVQTLILRESGVPAFFQLSPIIQPFWPAELQLPNLQKLDLSWQPCLSDDDMFAVVESCPHLKHLNIDCCPQLSSDALGHLNNCKRLEWLSFTLAASPTSGSLSVAHKVAVLCTTTLLKFVRLPESVLMEEYNEIGFDYMGGTSRKYTNLESRFSHVVFSAHLTPLGMLNWSTAVPLDVPFCPEKGSFTFFGYCLSTRTESILLQHIKSFDPDLGWPLAVLISKVLESSARKERNRIPALDKDISVWVEKFMEAKGTLHHPVLVPAAVVEALFLGKQLPSADILAMDMDENGWCQTTLVHILMNHLPNLLPSILKYLGSAVGNSVFKELLSESVCQHYRRSLYTDDRMDMSKIIAPFTLTIFETIFGRWSLEAISELFADPVVFDLPNVSRLFANCFLKIVNETGWSESCQTFLEAAINVPNLIKELVKDRGDTEGLFWVVAQHSQSKLLSEKSLKLRFSRSMKMLVKICGIESLHSKGKPHPTVVALHSGSRATFDMFGGYSSMLSLPYEALTRDLEKLIDWASETELRQAWEVVRAGIFKLNETRILPYFMQETQIGLIHACIRDARLFIRAMEWKPWPKVTCILQWDERGEMVSSVLSLLDYAMVLGLVDDVLWSILEHQKNETFANYNSNVLIRYLAAKCRAFPVTDFISTENTFVESNATVKRILAKLSWKPLLNNAKACNVEPYLPQKLYTRGWIQSDTAEILISSNRFGDINNHGRRPDESPLICLAAWRADKNLLIWLLSLPTLDVGIVIGGSSGQTAVHILSSTVGTLAKESGLPALPWMMLCARHPSNSGLKTLNIADAKARSVQDLWEKVDGCSEVSKVIAVLLLEAQKNGVSLSSTAESKSEKKRPATPMDEMEPKKARTSECDKGDDSRDHHDDSEPERTLLVTNSNKCGRSISPSSVGSRNSRSSEVIIQERDSFSPRGKVRELPIRKALNISSHYETVEKRSDSPSTRTRRDTLPATYGDGRRPDGDGDLSPVFSVTLVERDENVSSRPGNHVTESRKFEVLESTCGKSREIDSQEDRTSSQPPSHLERTGSDSTNTCRKKSVSDTSSVVQEGSGGLKISISSSRGRRVELEREGLQGSEAAAVAAEKNADGQESKIRVSRGTGTIVSFSTEETLKTSGEPDMAAQRKRAMMYNEGSSLAAKDEVKVSSGEPLPSAERFLQPSGEQGFTISINRQGLGISDAASISTKVTVPSRLNSSEAPVNAKNPTPTAPRSLKERRRIVNREQLSAQVFEACAKGDAQFVHNVLNNEWPGPDDLDNAPKHRTKGSVLLAWVSSMEVIVSEKISVAIIETFLRKFNFAWKSWSHETFQTALSVLIYRDAVASAAAGRRGIELSIATQTILRHATKEKLRKPWVYAPTVTGFARDITLLDGGKPLPNFSEFKHTGQDFYSLMIQHGIHIQTFVEIIQAFNELCHYDVNARYPTKDTNFSFNVAEVLECRMGIGKRKLDPLHISTQSWEELKGQLNQLGLNFQSQNSVRFR